jgi:hypothetical protein
MSNLLFTSDIMVDLQKPDPDVSEPITSTARVEVEGSVQVRNSLHLFYGI